MNGEADQAELKLARQRQVNSKEWPIGRPCDPSSSRPEHAMEHSAKFWQTLKTSVDKLGNGPAQLAAECVRRQVTVIVAAGTAAHGGSKGSDPFLLFSRWVRTRSMLDLCPI